MKNRGYDISIWPRMFGGINVNEDMKSVLEAVIACSQVPVGLVESESSYSIRGRHSSVGWKGQYFVKTP